MAFGRLPSPRRPRDAYSADWAHFSGWCRAHGLEPLPASPEIVAGYLSHLAVAKKSTSTIGRRLAAIRAHHRAAELPVPKSDALSETLSGIRRSLGTAARAQKAPATASILGDVLAAIGSKRPIDIRDRAILALGFAGAFRRSELVALNVEDIEFCEEGARVTIRRSKTDQTGSGQTIGIPTGNTLFLPGTCPAPSADYRPALAPKQSLRGYDLSESIGPNGPEKVVLGFTPAAAKALQAYRKRIAEQETDASGLFLSWIGKLPGLAVRLATVFEHLVWCGVEDGQQPPVNIPAAAAEGAIAFLDEYALPMARRCFGEAALPEVDLDAKRIARWVVKNKHAVSDSSDSTDSPPNGANGANGTCILQKINARGLRQASVLSTRKAERYDAALAELETAGWLRSSPGREGGGHGRQRKDWEINPRLWVAEKQSQPIW